MPAIKIIFLMSPANARQRSEEKSPFVLKVTTKLSGGFQKGVFWQAEESVEGGSDWPEDVLYSVKRGSVCKDYLLCED